MNRRDHTKERLKEAVASLTASEGFKTWLRLRTRTGLGRYSLFNQLLICSQCPEATRVAGFVAWQKLGRKVRKGEKAIWILAPLKRVVRTQDEESGEERSHTYLAGFTAEAVFDVSQTVGPRLPSYEISPRGEEAGEKEPLLLSFAASLGISVLTLDTGSAEGYFNPVKKEIALSDRLSPSARVHTLVHELVHALGVGYQEHGRAKAELITETAAAIVCAELGLDSVEESSFYLSAWANGEADEVVKHLQAADEIARQLEHALGLREQKFAPLSAA